MTPLAFFDIGFGEMVVVGVVALLLFGGRLPEVMRTLGASYRNLRRGWEDISRQALDPARTAMRQPYRPTPPANTVVPSAPAAVPSPAPWAAAAAPKAVVEMPAVPPRPRTPVPPEGTVPVAPAAASAPARAATPSRLDDDLPLV